MDAIRVGKARFADEPGRGLYAALSLRVIGLLAPLLVVMAAAGVLRGHGDSPTTRVQTTAVVRHTAFRAERLRAQGLRRERWLASPAARRQRLASQLAFHGLSRSGAQRLLVGDFKARLAAASANPAASIAAAGRVVRYLGQDRALVRTAHGLEEKISTAPLVVPGRKRGKQPVNLSLVGAGDGFRAVHPLTAVSIARSLAGGADVGPDGLRIAMEGADASGEQVGGQSVFFSGVARDTDADVAPTLDGVELFAVLRSRLSPEQLRYRLSLPAGAILRGENGGAAISRAGRVLARIPAPSAVDAQGVPVLVRMRVVGDELLLAVRHGTADVAYPVLVDPEVRKTEKSITTTSEGWKFSQTGVGSGSYSVGGGISVTLPATHYPLSHEGKEVESSTARLTYEVPANPEIQKVEFQGLSFEQSGETGEFSGTGAWTIVSCDQGFGEDKLANTSLFTLGHRGGTFKCESPIKFGVQAGNIVPGKAITAGASFSASAIVLTAAWHTPDRATESYGGTNEGEPEKKHCLQGDPVNCATGDLTETQTDLSVGGRGPTLGMTRYYNSQFAQGSSEHGAFGYGWTGSYGGHIVIGAKTCEECLETATVYQDNGSTTFFENYKGEWYAPAPLVQATLKTEGSTYVYTLPDQAKLTFESAGRLASETDRDGNTLTMHRNAEGVLESVSDPAGRELTFTYNSSGEVESVTDPDGYIVTYTYESGNLVSVTQPGGSALRWQFKYNGSHELTEMTDGRGYATKTEYNGSHQVISQTDPLEHKRSWKYGTTSEGSYTEITEPNEAVTREEFNSEYLPTSITRAYGTPLAATTTDEYDGYDNLIAVANPDKQTTKYTYNLAGDRITETNPDGDETKWEYDSTHDVISETTPDGETTTIKRESHGNPEVIERPAPGGKTETTKYKYSSHGEVESMTNPLEHTWKYEYDSRGDRTAEVDPEGNKRTWAYDEDSRVIETVSPRGNAGGEQARFATEIERDAQGRPTAILEPLESFGSFGSAAGQLDFPKGVAIDAHGNVWIVDTGNNRVEEFSETGAFVEAIGFGVGTGEGKFEICHSGCRAGIAGSGNGQFWTPRGAAFYSGTLYVADTENNRVEEFNEKGEYTGQFAAGVPSGIAVSPSGHLWVTVLLGSSVAEYSSTGTFIEDIGYGVSNGKNEFQICTTGCRSGIGGTKNGQFYFPQYATFDGANLYVSDSSDNRVQEFNEKGEYVTKFGTAGGGKTVLRSPTGIAASPSTGNLYISDEGDQRVKEVTSTGELVQEYRDNLSEPMGVAVNSAGAVYVVDSSNARVAYWTAPTPRVTKYTYDADGEVQKVTDPNGDTTKYTYNADDELTGTEEPNKTVTETEYDDAGQVIGQVDGNKHKTKYKRNALEEVTEVTDPLSRATTKEYDAAGNLVKLTDSAKRVTTYIYDPANRLKSVSYSDGKTHDAEYEYNKDGLLTKMIDGTGTTKYTYDQLDRLTEIENGHKETIKHEYDLANDLTTITYPNGKEVTRAFDRDGRLEKVIDWLKHETKFTYDPDSDPKATIFPGETNNEDTYTYNNVDQMTEDKMAKSTETLASLAYTRDNDGQVKKTTAKGLPGAEVTEATYDENARLTKYGSTEYKYDSANNPTKEASSENTFNEGDELEKSTGATYTYNEVGQRTDTTPSTGPSTTFGYDQAGNLTTVERPKEGVTPEIKDSYAYNGSDLRTSQTISGITSYFTWDEGEETPLLLSDGTNSYIYGPGGLPVEQINYSTGAVLYLHHDQQGSTRLITGLTGKVEGKCSYSAYGTPTCEGSATTPLGYDGQYTSSDTGLVYLRNRVYDPSTAQFLSRDPLTDLTWEPYSYAFDNSVNNVDPSGLEAIPFPVEGPEAAACLTPEAIGPCVVVGGAGYIITEGVKSIVNAWTGEEPGNDEGEAFLRQRELEEAEQASQEECVQEPPRSLPYQGEPDSTSVLDRGNGTGQIRDYGPDGLPLRDFDFGHDHGFGDPHAHDWLEGVRGSGRPVGANE